MYIDIRTDEPITDIMVADELSLMLPGIADKDDTDKQIIICELEKGNCIPILVSEVPNLILGLTQAVKLIHEEDKV